jgi:N,N'-diacetyllegionaminate synthase
MSSRLAIAGRLIGRGEPCFVIAEAGVNHEGSRNRALAMVDIAADSGADAIKFQTFDVDLLATRDAPKAQYQIETTGADESQYEMLRRLQLTPDDHRALAERCAERDILFMSTPFDEGSADFLNALPLPVFKLPSGELTNIPFLMHVARFGKPLIVSTGMATLGEVETAIHAILAVGNENIAILHCVSNYPAAAADANLSAMATMEHAFGVPVGYSDHTTGLSVGLASVALGAAIVEKHFTLDRALPGPDHRASLEPDELRAFVLGVRDTQAALGNGQKVPVASEAATAAIARKSLVAAVDIAVGTILNEMHLAAKRPGTGLSPALRGHVLGRSSRISIPAGTILSWEMLG